MLHFITTMDDKQVYNGRCVVSREVAESSAAALVRMFAEHGEVYTPARIVDDAQLAEIADTLHISKHVFCADGVVASYRPLKK